MPGPRSSLLLLLAMSFAGAPPLVAGELNDKAARLLEPLQKRPGSGVLFERFVNAWLDSGTLEELGRFLTERAAADPSTANRLLLALFHSRQGETVKSLEQFRAALASDAGSAEVWYQKAVLESRTLDFASAIVSLEKCLALKPAGELPLQAAQLLGRLQARAGRSAQAIQTWRALMETRPDDEELREDILELQISESLWPAAQETAQALVEKTADPYRRVLRRMRLGDVLDRSGQRDRALETFAACLADTGAGSWLEKEILSQIEKLFRREDDLSGLRAYFTKLLETHAHRAGLQRAQARLLMEAGETDAAIACGRALMELSPGDRAVREEFIALLNGAGRTAEAVSQMAQLVAQAPDDLELRLTLAELKQAARDTEGALTALRDYAQRAGGREGTALRVAGLMDRWGATAEAVTTLRAALEKSDQPDVRQMLAALLHKSGRKEEALTEWQRIAAAGGLPQVQQTARAMQAHGEGAAAWELMMSAAPRAGSDAVFLTQLCALAEDPERARAVLPFAHRLVELARSASDLNHALDAARRAVVLSGQEDEFTAGLADSAASAQSLCLLAVLREGARDTPGAEAALEKARTLSPELALSQSARLWTMRGDFVRAAAAGEQWFNSPGGRQGHVAEMLASLQQRAGNPAEALRWTQEWRRLVPGAAAPVLAEARLLEALGRENEAFAVLRSAAGRMEDHADIQARLASFSLQAGRPAEALRVFSRLYEDAADLSGRMRWLGEWGEAAQAAGQLDSLIAQFEERRRENRGSIAPLMALAELHRIADNYESRRNALTEAARLKPDDPEIALEIARLESREGDTEAAIRTLRPMLSKDPSGRVASLLADLLINSGQLDEGIRLLTERTAASPGAAELAALSLARRDEEATALRFLLPHLEKHPADWRLQFLAALIEWRTGAHDAAVARLLPLLEAANPLARAGGSAVLTASPGYDDMVVRLMPPDVQRFFRVLQESNNLTGASYAQWAQSRQSPYTSLPAGLEELRDRAAALALELAKSAAEEKQSVWIAEIERRGYPFAKLMLELPPMRGLRPADRDYDFTELLRRYPDNRLLLALAANFTSFRNWREPADVALAEQAWKAFRTDAPRAAIYLALPGAGHGESPAAWESEVLAAAEELEHAPALLQSAAARSAGFSGSDEYRGVEISAPGPWQQRIVALLNRWRADQAGTAGNSGPAAAVRNMVFQMLARDCVVRGDAAALATLLESEWQEQSAAPPLAANDDDIAAPLGFPPWFVPGLSERLSYVLRSVVSAEVAAQTAPLVKDAVLRVLLAGKANGEALERAMQDVPPAASAPVVPLILHAAWAEKRGDFAAAAEHAVKALYSPVSQELRRRLDGALAWWAAKKGRPGDALHAAGREAVLRLRRDATTQERRAELATLMDRLGLTEEADRLMRQGKAAESALAATPDERLERLLDEGRNKEALPVLLSDLRGWARLKINSGGEPSRDTLMEWRTRVQANGLLPQVMQALLPPGATPQQTAEFAAACELTGDLIPAREHYEKALAAGVQKRVPQLLLSILVQSDHGAAMELLQRHPELLKPEAVQRWMQQMVSDRSRTARMEELLTASHFFERMLQELPPEHFGPGFPAATVLEFCGGEALAGEFHSVSEVASGNRLDLLGEPPSAAETERVRALAAERLASYARLAEAFARLPCLKSAAWQELEQSWSLLNKPPEELLALQLEMVLRELEPDRPERRGSVSPSQLPDLLDSLMLRAVKLERGGDFAAKIVPAVQRRFSPETAARLLKKWPLFECPREAFAAAAQRFLEQHGAKEWGTVIRAAHERGAGAELAPQLLTYYSNPDPKAKERNEDAFGIWCALLERLEGREAAERFFRDVMERLPGPAAGRAAVFKDASSLPLTTAILLTASLAQQESWTGYVMRWLRAEFIPHASAEVEESMADAFGDWTVSAPLFRLTGEGRLPEAKAYLDSLPLTGDLTDFYGVSGDVITYVARALQNLSAEQRGALGLGEDSGNLTFGRRVLRGAAAGWLDGVCRELAGEEDRIEALPEPQGSLVQAQLRGIHSELSADAGREARAFHAWLFRERLAKQREETERGVEDFLKQAANHSFESADALEAELGRLLDGMAEAAHPRGREVIAAAARAFASQELPGEEGALLELLQDHAQDYTGRPPSHALPWFTGLTAEAIRCGEPAAEAYDNNFGGIGGILLQSVDTSVEGRLSAFMERLGPFLRPGDARLFMMCMMENLSRQYPWQEAEQRCAEGVKWAELQRGVCAFEELRLEMEMALRFHLSTCAATEARAAADESSLPVEQRHYLTMLRDASLSELLRLTLGVTLFESASLLDSPHGALQPALVHEVAQLLRHCLTERITVTPAQEAGVFTALALLPAGSRDAALVKSLLPLTTLPRLRGEANDYSTSSGLVGLLHLALEAGDDGTVERLLEMDGRFPGQGAVAMLARHVRGGRLAALLKDRPEVLQNSDDSYTFGDWDAALQSRLPDVLKGIADPVLRYETLVCLTLSGDPDPLPPGLTPRAARLTELAKSFAAVPWKGLSVRDRVLSRFIYWHDAVPEELMPVISESCARVPLTAVPHMDESRDSEWAGFSAVVLSRALVSGDGEPLLDALQSLLQTPRADSGVVSGILQSLLDYQHMELLRRWPELTPDVRSRLGAFWLRLADACDAPWLRSEWIKQIQFALLLHALAENMEDFRSWHAALPETERLVLRRYAAMLAPEEFVREFGGALEQMPGTPEEQRARRLTVFRALALSPLESGPGVNFDSQYLSMEGATPEEFLTLEAPLCAELPEDGWLAAAFARVHAARGAWEPVLFRCHAALTKMKPERGTAYAPLLELRVEALEHTGRGEAALPEILALAAMPESRSPGPDPSRAAESRLLRRVSGPVPPEK